MAGGFVVPSRAWQRVLRYVEPSPPCIAAVAGLPPAVVADTAGCRCAGEGPTALPADNDAPHLPELRGVQRQGRQVGAHGSSVAVSGPANPVRAA